MPEQPIVSQLVEKIHAAFATIPYPGDDQLVYDTSGCHLECVEVAAAFRGRRWQDVPLDTLTYEYASVFFFSPEAYRYYLPAFMIASLTRFDAAGNVPDSTIFSLTAPQETGPIRDRFFHIVSGFTPQQKTIIRAFLQVMAREHSEFFSILREPDIALQRYWSQF